MKVFGYNNSFVVTQNNLDGLKAEDKSVANAKRRGYNIFFKLYDDDDILYYSGYLHENEEDEFAPLDWGMADSGCTRIDVRNPKTGKMETV